MSDKDKKTNAENIKINITPEIFYQGEKLQCSEPKLEVEVKGCPYCKEDITYEQVREIIGSRVVKGKTIYKADQNKVVIEKCIKYLNAWKLSHNLDTCLRKAHFIGQIALECGFVPEAERSDYKTPKNVWPVWKNNIKVNNTIINSLKSHLSDIFKVKEKGIEIKKNNDDIAKLIEGIYVNLNDLYGNFSGKDLLMKKEKKTEVFLKAHTHFGIEILSRQYASDGIGNHNGDESSRDGYRFRGRGLKQVTFKDNYASFSKWREDNLSNLPGDPNSNVKYLDFTKTTTPPFTGNYDLLADLQDPVYGVQSAIWFYNDGVKIAGNHAVDWADEDDIEMVTKVINGGLNGIMRRRDFTFKAKEQFKVYEHYEVLHKSSTVEKEQIEIENKLLSIGKTHKVKDSRTKVPEGEDMKVDLADITAKELAEKLKRQRENPPLDPIESIPITFIKNKDKKEPYFTLIIEPRKKPSEKEMKQMRKQVKKNEEKKQNIKS